jgi:hypothetical protein
MTYALYAFAVLVHRREVQVQRIPRILLQSSHILKLFSFVHSGFSGHTASAAHTMRTPPAAAQDQTTSSPPLQRTSVHSQQTRDTSETPFPVPTGAPSPGHPAVGVHQGAAAVPLTPQGETRARAATRAAPARSGERSGEAGGQPSKPPTGLRSKRAPRTVFSPPFVAAGPAPLEPINENRPLTRKRKEPGSSTGVYFETLEEYVQYMTTKGRAKRAKRSLGLSAPPATASIAEIRAFARRRDAQIAKLRVSVPRHIANKAMIEALEARPSKEMY